MKDWAQELRVILDGYRDQGGTITAANEQAAIRELARKIRDAAFLEAAKVCEDLDDRGEWGESAAVCAKAIRARIAQ